MFWAVVLGCVVILILHFIYKKKCLKCDDNALSLLQDFKLLVEYLKTAAWLHLSQTTREKSKLGKHSYNGKTANELGLLPNPYDIYVEEPHDLLDGTKKTDEISFIAGDTKTSILLKISRSHTEVTNIWITIVLPDGTTLVHPKNPDTRFQSRKGQTFQCEGLKFTCLSALRKWRIRYNGVLERVGADGHEKRTHHVQFTLLWSSFSEPEEGFKSKNQFLVYQLANQNFKRNSENLKRLESDFQGYDQWGMFHGTMRIDSQDIKEILLFGVKERKYGAQDIESNLSMEKLYCFTDDGKCIKLTKNVLADREALYYGYLIPPVLRGCQIKWKYNESRISGDSFEDKTIHMSNGKKCFDIEIKKITTRTSFFVGSRCETNTEAKFYTVQMDGEAGWAIGFKNTINDNPKAPISLKIYLTPSDISAGPCVIPFSKDLCRSSNLCGGKGSSLALLTKLSLSSQQFQVPNGLVVTTEAYWDHLRQNRFILDQINHLNDIATSKKSGNVEESCSTVVEVIKSSDICDGIKTSIINELRNIFGNNFENKKFAIRSSAIGEDSEEFSAAGQNETLLGVVGKENIFSAILECWASQFKIIAIQYKKQNGQELNPGMAVVIQEMVPSETAGVMFTQDPVTGNPTLISISANFGLGESVVSGITDPDNFLLEKQVDGVQILKSEIGEKRIRINLKSDGGTATEEDQNSEQSQSCLSEELLHKLGKLGLLVEDNFGGPRDVEWAIVGQVIFLLQSRPVTSIDIESEFELSHEMDGPINCKYDMTTNANVQEVCPGALAHLTIGICTKAIELGFQALQAGVPTNPQQYNPFNNVMAKFGFNNLALSSLNTFFFNNPKEVNKNAVKILMINMYGHEIDYTELRKRGIQRYGYCPGYRATAQLAYTFWRCWSYDRRILRLESKLANFPLKPDNFNDSKILYRYLMDNIRLIYETSNIHNECSGFSTMWNLIITNTIVGNEEDWPKDLWTDVSKMLGSCDTVSASVPEMLSDLAQTISKVKPWSEFQEMDPKEAKEWLEHNLSAAGQKYKTFLEIHGHRCLKEFDLLSETWAMKPEVLIKTLQCIRLDNINVNKKPTISETNEEVIDKLRIPMTKNMKKFLRFSLPRAKAAVARRERTKSLLVGAVHIYRMFFRRLGKLMMWEGRLPEEDLIFFMTLDELEKVLNNRSTRLVSKALRRKKLHAKLNSIHLEETMTGLPKPLIEEDISQLELDAASITVKGIPVSDTNIEGIARVVTKLEDATSIQPGEILVTIGTDIGWSPYFPILGGVVTELGGIISHGAVVAREYGIPCLIGARRATKIFKTGDKVLLDSSKGLLIKL